MTNSLRGDTGDIAAANAELRLKLALEQKADPNRHGPTKCTHCGYRNDRADKGYAVCSDCFLEINGVEPTDDLK